MLREIDGEVPVLGKRYTTKTILVATGSFFLAFLILFFAACFNFAMQPREVLGNMPLVIAITPILPLQVLFCLGALLLLTNERKSFLRLMAESFGLLIIGAILLLALFKTSFELDDPGLPYTIYFVIAIYTMLFLVWKAQRKNDKPEPTYSRVHKE